MFFNSLSCMEKPQELLIAPLGLPTDVWKIIADYVIAGDSCKESARNFHALGKTNRFFSQNEVFNQKLVLEWARQFRGELDDICPHDLVFAAAYQLNTQGARKWMKEKYLTDVRNFKIIAHSFFKRLTPDNPRTPHLQSFIAGIMPAEIPFLIQRRIHFILISQMAKQKGFPNEFINNTWPGCRELICLGETPDNFCTALYNNSAAQLEDWYLKAPMIHHNGMSWGSDPDLANHIGMTPLDAVSQDYQAAPLKIKKLLEYGANPNNRSRDGACLLGQALYHGTAEDLKILLEAGANPDTTLTGGDTPLTVAIRIGHLAKIKSLFQFNTDPDKCNTTGLHPIEAAFVNATPEVIKLILNERSKKPKRKSLKEITPLYETRYPALVKLILEAEKP